MPANTPARQLTDDDRNSIAGFVKDVVGTTLQESLDYSSDFPAFLADPTPSVGPFAVAKAVGQQSCRRWARGEGIPSLPGFDAFYGGICEPYLDSIGENPDDGSLLPPFEGGQCATNYLGTALVGGTEIQQGGLTPRNLTGPLGGVTKTTTPIGGGSVRVVWTFDNQGSDNFIGIQYRPGFGPDPTFKIERTDQQPDDCGNPPSDYTPPQIPPGLPPLEPVPVDIPGIGPVNIDVGFEPDGDIVITLPDVGVEVTIPNPLDGEPGGGGGGGGAPEQPPPGFQGQPGDSTDTADEPVEEEDPDRYLIGVLVQTITVPPRTKTRFNDSTAYYAGLYYVYMGGENGLSQAPAALVRQDEFFYAPPNANRFRVEPNPGAVIRVTPFWEDVAE